MSGTAEQVAAAAAAVDEATRRYQMGTVETAAMGERITNLNRRQSDFEGETRTALSNINDSVRSLAGEMRTSIATLTTNISERSRPQWQAMSVALIFAGMLGGLTYMPIREAMSDLKSAVQTLADRAVTRDELEWRAGRAVEDRVRMEAALADIRSNLVPRAEHSQVLQDLRDRIDRIEMGRLRIGPYTPISRYSRQEFRGIKPRRALPRAIQRCAGAAWLPTLPASSSAAGWSWSRPHTARLRLGPASRAPNRYGVDQQPCVRCLL